MTVGDAPRCVAVRTDRRPCLNPVELLQQRANGDIKIGFSSQLPLRLKSLSNEFGPLEVLGAVVGGRRMERALHDRFKAFALGAEWFSPSEEVFDFISASCVDPLEKLERLVTA